MKVAFVKNMYDSHGPWESIAWKDTNLKDLLFLFPTKVTFWEMSCLLKADWYIISDFKIKSDYLNGIIKNKKRREIANKYTKNIVPSKDIPYGNYDVIISFYPILDIPKNSQTLFTYIVNEDWDRIYYKSLKHPIRNYDLCLDHMLKSNFEIDCLPQVVSFPFLFSQEVTKSVFDLGKKEEKIWVEWRTLTTLTGTDLWDEGAEKACQRLEDILEFPVICKGNFNKGPSGIGDTLLWGNGYQYLKNIGECKYYIGVGRKGGPGQGLVDAASMGSICIGETNKSYHRLVCHPELMCRDLFDLPSIVKKVISSKDLQKEALDYQNIALKENFIEKPLSLLERAIKIKRSHQRKNF